VTGRHRHPATRPVAAAIGLLVALAVSGWLLASPTPQPEGSARSGPGSNRLAAVWPKAKLTEYADSSPYRPVLFLNLTTSVGTSAASDGGQRLLLVRRGHKPRVLHTMDPDAQPGFGAIASDGRTITWVESMPGESGRAGTTLWRAGVAGGGVRKLTGDTGNAVFSGSQYDLQIVGKRLYWTAQPSRKVTEVRSMPLEGGAVRTQRLTGAYALTRWPWAVSVGGAGTDPVKLHNVDTGRTVTVPPGNGEMTSCGPAWCRVVTLGSGGVTRLAVMRPDGSKRRQVPGAHGQAVNPAVVDVMLADRFEPVTVSARNSSGKNQQLWLFDAKTGRLVLVSDTVSTVRGRGDFLWWSTGEAERQRWHVLDLRSL